jgi:hypothetical protein
MINARQAVTQLAGVVAADIVADLTGPLRSVAESLAVMVDAIDRHVANSTGPTPYSWKSLGQLRQELATSYLDATVASRRMDDLRAVMMTVFQSPELLAVGEAVEVGVHLAGHHVGDHVELLVDLAPTSLARCERGGLALVVARAVAICAQSAVQRVGSTLTVRTSSDGDHVLVMIADNGVGLASIVDEAEVMARVVEVWGATVDVATSTGQGCSVLLRLGT